MDLLYSSRTSNPALNNHTIKWINWMQNEWVEYETLLGSCYKQMNEVIFAVAKSAYHGCAIDARNLREGDN